MKITNCRFCNGLLPEIIFKLSDTPLANEFLSSPAPQETFTLNLTSCSTCHLYQLDYSVPAEKLFNKDYAFVTGTSSANVEYFREYALDVISRFNLKAGDFVVEIASNDGTLLKVFKEFGIRTLGIDPAKSIANKATEEGIETLPEFFTEELAKNIVIKYGKAKVVIGNNFMAHIDNVNDIVKGIKILTDNDGVFIFENSYFADVYKKNIVDLIYHEHKSQFLVYSLLILFQINDMCLFDVQSTPVHGGSIRCFVSGNHKTSETVDIFIKEERRLGLIVNDDKGMTMAQWTLSIAKLSSQLNYKLKDYKKDGVIVDIFGFPAKITTLLYGLGLDRNLFRYGYDHAPLKQNRFSPGYHIPIFSPDKIVENNPDIIYIGAWNFAKQIMKNCRENGYRGGFIIPLPELMIIESVE